MELGIYVKQWVVIHMYILKKSSSKVFLRPTSGTQKNTISLFPSQVRRWSIFAFHLEMVSKEAEGVIMKVQV